MQFTTLMTMMTMFIIPAVDAFTTSVSYDTIYDNDAVSSSSVACSNKLFSVGFPSFGTIPTFPNIGGSSVVTGFNAPQCVTCWKLTLSKNSVFVIVIDTAGEGFNLSEEAMNTLTDGQAVKLGRVSGVNAVQMDSIEHCGIL